MIDPGGGGEALTFRGNLELRMPMVACDDGIFFAGKSGLFILFLMTISFLMTVF